MSNSPNASKAVISSVLTVSVIASLIAFSGCGKMQGKTTFDTEAVTFPDTVFVTEATTYVTTDDVKLHESDTETEETSTENIVTDTTQDITDTVCSVIPNYDLRYFFTFFDEDKLKIVCDLYTAAQNFDEAFTLSGGVDEDTFHDILTIMRVECPELFQIDFDEVALSDEGTTVSMKYRITEDEYTKMKRDVESIVGSLVSVAEKMDSDTDKEKYVFDYFARGCTYDPNAKNADTAYGALVESPTSSIGVSLAMKWVMEELGIRCICVTADRSGSDISHAWNIVEINGAFTIVDLIPSIIHSGDNTNEIIYCALNVADDWVEDNYFVHDTFSRIAVIPSCDKNDEGYLAKLGFFITEGTDPTYALNVQLRSAVINGGGNVYLQFESDSDLDAFIDVAGTKIKTWFDEKKATYSSISYTVYEYNVCVVYIEK